MNTEITPQDIATARRVYWWLLFAPILALPCWAGSYGLLPSHDLVSSVIAAALPLVFYLPVFLWSFSLRPFVRAHAQQGMLLLALRFLLAAWAGYGSDWGLLWWNALLWFFGGGIGIIQAGSGRAWIGNLQAQIVTAPPPPAAADANARSIQHYLSVFRSGDPSAREDAARRLKALGQVEIF